MKRWRFQKWYGTEKKKLNPEKSTTNWQITKKPIYFKCYSLFRSGSVFMQSLSIVFLSFHFYTFRFGLFCSQLFSIVCACHNCILIAPLLHVLPIYHQCISPFSVTISDTNSTTTITTTSSIVKIYDASCTVRLHRKIAVHMHTTVNYIF